MNVAEFSISNATVTFAKSSRDNFANGVEVSPDGHSATAWIGDTDADVSVTGTDDEGATFSIAIHTNSVDGAGPYILFSNPVPAGTKLDNVSGVVSQFFGG